MESTSILDFQNMPELRSRVLSATENTFSGGFSLMPYNRLHLLFMLSGAATCVLNNDDGYIVNFPANHLFFVSQNESVSMIAVTERCRFIDITYELFAELPPSEAVSPAAPRFTAEYMRIVPPTSSMAIEKLENAFPCFLTDVNSLFAQCLTLPQDIISVRYALDKVLYSVMRYNFGAAVNVLTEANSLWLKESGNDGKAPLSLTVSNICVLSCPAAKNIAAAKIFEADLKSICSEHDNLDSSCTVDYDSGQNALIINSNGSDGLELPIISNGTEPILKQHTGDCRIVLKLKCSRPAKLTLLFRHIPSYKSIGYDFTVDKPDTETEQIIRISDNSTVRVLPANVERAIHYIQSNLSEKLSVSNIADYVNIHPSYLSALFRENLGQSVNGYINGFRITVAKQLLRNSANSITDIALQTGFYDAQHFLKTFKKITGFTPSEYRAGKHG